MNDLAKVPRAHPANVSRIADFAEIECLYRADGNVSVLDIVRIMMREDDSSSEDNVEQNVAEAFDELADRASHCGSDDGRYPYRVLPHGRLLQLRPRPGDSRVPSGKLYIYLLLATRMNMKSERTQDGEDATVLFEHLCSEVAVRFWGGPERNVRARVFGTGRQTEDLKDDDGLDGGSFERAVNDLCRELQEGHGFRNPDASQIRARDGKLDVVVWRRFADNRPGQLIGFGQCKTGKHWPDDLMKLRPEGFCKKWMQRQPAVLPVRLYFVADRVVSQWYERCADAGILFDRCRIVEYSDNLSAGLTKRIASWVTAAAASQGLSLP